MKQNLKKICLLSLTLLSAAMSAQDYYSPETRRQWLKTAEDNKPELLTAIKSPLALTAVTADAAAFQGYKAVQGGSIKDFYAGSLIKQSGTVLDFGEHLTGYFTFSLKTINSIADAPVRLKFTFGEVPSEIAVPFDPYSGGLSRAWLQDEVVTVTEFPATITVPRRLAFRYVKVEVLGSSPYFDFALTDCSLKAQTSVRTSAAALAPGTSELIKKIDQTALNTLKECMQTVFEDGPKRDRRLWIGDVVLEAQANMYSFKEHALTKRCLYLLASLAQEDGFLYSNVFETPAPHAQEKSPFLFDYSLLYNVSLKDYLTATGDKQTALDLWPVAKRQMDNITVYLDKEGVFDAQQAAKDKWWLFVDWNDKLDRQAAIQGIMIYSMKETLALAKSLGKEKEVSQLPALIAKMSAGAKKHLFDKNLGLFVSGSSRQVSYASQSWLILAGVAKDKEAQKVLQALQQHKNALKPGAPYMYHYYVQALINSGLRKEARAVVENYWGGMVNKGADTFWEVYDPENEQLSPYNFFPINSYCHAWSCTPTFFIRKYPDVFQN